MNWKQTLFWSFSAAAIFYYFLLFGVFVFVGQEEMQLFIPEWWYIREFLFQPGRILRCRRAMDHSILPAAYVGGGFPYGFTRWLRIYGL